MNVMPLIIFNTIVSIGVCIYLLPRTTKFLFNKILKPFLSWLYILIIKLPIAMITNFLNLFTFIDMNLKPKTAKTPKKNNIKKQKYPEYMEVFEKRRK